MELALAFGALLLGLAGIPHCAAMCGAACATVLPASSAPSFRGASWAFHGARITGYSLAGGVAAAGVGLVSSLGASAPLLRPVWTLLHVSALGLGLWLLVTGRQPGWMTRVATGRPHGAGGGHGSWQRMVGPGRALAAGSLWVAWPCGLLQSALVMAGLANTPLGGAGVMFAFAGASAAGLQLAPWALGRIAGAVDLSRLTVWAVRAAGLMLAAGSAWALGHDAWDKVIAYCFG